MKLQPTLNCHICNTASPGTFLHMFWECPDIYKFWLHVNSVLADILDIFYVPNPGFCLLNDSSGINLKQIQLRMVFSGFTSAKKTILKNWFFPDMCMKSLWIHSLVNIVNLEHTTARLNKARPETVQAWNSFSSKIISWTRVNS